jgi:hypothetical protein
MSILDQKNKVFGNIAALRTLIDGLPKLKTTNSFPSINNTGDSIAFLTDLIKSLVGYEELVREFVDILVYGLKDIEVEVKNALKDELKSIVSCGVNPSLPPFLTSTGTGITFTVNKIDFSNSLLINPLSTSGQLLYNDLTPNLIDSSDFNTFLYQTIQNNGSTEAWKNILDINFNDVDITGINPNNTIKINSTPLYDNKSLTDLNNDFVDSITLFNTEHLVNNLVDVLFGSIATTLNKTVGTLANDANLNTVIDKIVNNTEGTIEDKVFTFTKTEIQKNEELATLRSRGTMIVQGANQIESSIPISNLTTFNDAMSGATTMEAKKNVVTTNLDSMAVQSAVNSPSVTDVPTIKLNFIQQLINNLTKSIINIVLSPKVVTIFILNYKIIYGPSSEYGNAIDFIKNNKTLFHNIMKRIAGLIVKRLLNIALKRITELVAETAAKEEIEKNKANLTQLLSLVGVPQETLRLIKGL